MRIFSELSASWLVLMTRGWLLVVPRNLVGSMLELPVMYQVTVLLPSYSRNYFYRCVCASGNATSAARLLLILPYASLELDLRIRPCSGAAQRPHSECRVACCRHTLRGLKEYMLYSRGKGWTFMMPVLRVLVFRSALATRCSPRLVSPSRSRFRH